MKGNGKKNKLMTLRSQMKDMSQNYQDMIKTKEQAKKQLETRFQTVYEQIHENKRFTINEYNRIIGKLSVFQEIFEKDDVSIEPNAELSLDKTLLNTRTDFDFKVSPYKRQIIEMKNWISRHKHFYLYEFGDEFSGHIDKRLLSF